MKEPILVMLMVWAENKEDFTIQLPMKKINCMCQIEKERLLRFLIKYQQIKLQDKDAVVFEFFDFFNQRFVQEKDITIPINIYQFSEKFLGLPEQLVLKVAIYYNFSYTNFVELYDTLEMFKLDQKKFQEEKINYQKQLQEYDQELQEMKNTLDDIQNTLSTQKQEKQLPNADIVILYSNPIIRVNNQIKESLFIDYESEIKQIQTMIDKSGQSIKYQIFNATLKNLELAFSLHPLIIHVISHGDFDEKQQIFYLEFQDDGVSIRLKTDEIQNMIQNNKGMTRIKLICVSSIVSKNITEYIPKNVSWVVFQKLYNIIDKEGPLFWGNFYENIFKNFSIEAAYKSAKSALEKAFWNNQEKIVCCCFHEHEPKCPFDPAQIGYEISHQQHLQCAKQRWTHIVSVQNQCEPKSYLGNFILQCKNNCIGRIILSCNKHNKCEQQYFKKIDTILQKLEIEQIDKTTLKQNLTNIDDNRLICCCCQQINVILATQSESNLSSKVPQHTYEQRINFQKANNLQFLELLGQNQDKIQDIKFTKIDKQIILIHSQDQQNEELKQETLLSILSYFKIYMKQKSNIKKIKEVRIDLNLCEANNWMEFVSKMLNFQHTTSDEFIIKSQDFLNTLKSQDQFFYIFIIENIQNVCNSDYFNKFYKTFLEANETHFILILSINNIQKENLKKITPDELVQLIDLNQIKIFLDTENIQK